MKKLKNYPIYNIVAFAIILVYILIKVAPFMGLTTNSNEINTNGIRGSANFMGLTLCSRKKVGKILLRKLTDNEISSTAEKQIFYEYKENPNLTFRLTNPKRDQRFSLNSDFFSGSCECDIEFDNANDSYCRLFYSVEEENGKHRVNLAQIYCEKVEVGSLKERGFE